MKFNILIFLVVSTFYAQEIRTPFTLNTDVFIGIDTINNIYYLKDNTLYKKNETKIISYSNIHLGELTQVDISNSLKIVLFYKDFNTVIILDNELNELTNTLNFNTLINNTISFVGATNNTNLWLFSENNTTLYLWNYQTKKINTTTVLQDHFNYKMACSNQKNSWLISNTKAIQYNQYGSFINQLNLTNIKNAVAYKNGLIYQIDKQLFYYSDHETKTIPFKNNIEIVDFNIQNNWLYYFDGKLINKIEL